MAVRAARGAARVAGVARSAPRGTRRCSSCPRSRRPSAVLALALFVLGAASGLLDVAMNTQGLTVEARVAAADLRLAARGLLVRRAGRRRIGGTGRAGRRAARPRTCSAVGALVGARWPPRSARSLPDAPLHAPPNPRDRAGLRAAAAGVARARGGRVLRAAGRGRAQRLERGLSLARARRGGRDRRRRAGGVLARDGRRAARGRPARGRVRLAGGRARRAAGRRVRVRRRRGRPERGRGDRRVRRARARARFGLSAHHARGRRRSRTCRPGSRSAR